MNHWIFKISDQDQFPDQDFEMYVFNRKHSISVRDGDAFVYLDKRKNRFGFIGHGQVREILSGQDIQSRLPDYGITTDFVALLDDCVRYTRPLDFKASTKQGRANRALLGVKDASRIGWSRSIARLNQITYEQLIDLAYEKLCVDVEPSIDDKHAIPDDWSYNRRRGNLARFKRTVLDRQNHMCAICGTSLQGVLDVAHISGYAVDIANRANPANGIVLCAYCHRAFDNGAFQIQEDGTVASSPNVKLDSIATAHLKNLTPQERLELIDGVDKALLSRRK